MASSGIDRLFARYGRLLDDEKWDAWLELFEESATYAVTTRENLAKGLALPLLLCESKAMLEDRVFAATKANVYMPQLSRHVIGLPVPATDEADGDAEASVWSASFALFRTDSEGKTILNAVGELELRFAQEEPPRIGAARVILDTAQILTSLPKPI